MPSVRDEKQQENGISSFSHPFNLISISMKMVVV